MPQRVTVQLLLAVSVVQLTVILIYIQREQPAAPLFHLFGQTTPPKQIDFSWNTLEARHDLHWKDCYSDRHCARLIVPLDHTNPNGKEATIAIIRKPSRFSRTSPSYRGPILFNPGGPGASGVDFLQNEGDLFATIVGPQFDVVAFDPRGIGRSTPVASFFKTPVERELFGELTGLANYSVEGVARTWARAHILGRLAEINDDGGLRYLNTEQTAHDMMSIVRAYGETKLQYWGMSYGTVLGAVFASLFPSKVERIVLDGVVDADGYFGNKWSNSLSDADKVLEYFFTSCSAAGPLDCAFWAPTPADIRANFSVLNEAVRKAPVPAFSQTGTVYGLLDYSRLRYTVFRSLYEPIASFRLLAHGLAALAAGDAGPLYALQASESFSCDVDVSVRYRKDFTTAILCNDNLRVPGDLSWTEEYFDMMAKSSHFGAFWATKLIECQNWPKFPKTNFRGPFQGNTSHPILLVGNTADSVTPLWGAHKMAEGFTGSVVLTQDSFGHCSTSAVSLCTAHYIRNYFLTGSLPERDTICNATSKPFPQSSPRTIGGRSSQNIMSIPTADHEMLAALSRLSNKERIVPHHLFSL